MPMRRVASITRVPGGTCTSRSLIFRVTSFWSVMFVRLFEHSPNRRRAYREPTSASADL